jgi:hypothetical protein
MSIINARNTVSAHLFRERFEVFLAVIIPFVFMLESGYANAYIFGAGHFAFDLATGLSLGRGFALEIFIFFCFRMIRSFFMKRAWWSAVPLLLIGMVSMIVSAGLNLGFMSQSPEMASVLQAVTEFMPAFMVSIFRFSLGLLFPVGVGLFALYDVSHLITEMLASSNLEDQAMMVHRSSLHRAEYTKSLKRGKDKVAKQYDDIAQTDAQNMVDAVRKGDMSFGSAQIAKAGGQKAGVVKVTPTGSNALPPGQPGQQLKLPAPGQPLPALPSLHPKP